MRTLGKFLKCSKGNAIIEFAFFATTALFMFPVGIDFAKIINVSMELSSAVRTGMQYAVANPTNTATVSTIVQNASGLPSANVTATTTQFCECNGTSMASCGSTCAGTIAKYDTISASYSVSTLISYRFVSNPYTVTRTIKVRVN